MTTETSTPPQTAALAEWLVTFVMSKGGRRRVFIYTIPATGYQAALKAAYRLIDCVHESSDGLWDNPCDVTATVA
jgi:hypothetical protein